MDKVDSITSAQYILVYHDSVHLGHFHIVLQRLEGRIIIALKRTNNYVQFSYASRGFRISLNRPLCRRRS